MVSLHSIVVSDPHTATALNELADRLERLRAQPSFLCVFYDANHDDREISAFFARRYPGVAMLGGSSCGGVMSEQGLGGKASIGVLLVEDPAGDYGVSARRLSDKPAADAEQALYAALAQAGCPGELPELIWIYQAPGHEEQVLAGLRKVVGERCPILGGSSADNEVAGQWRQLGPDGPMDNGLVVGVLFSSGGISCAFQGGYEPAGPCGRVTGVSRHGSAAASDVPAGHASRSTGRCIQSIDHQPAAEIYNRWNGGLVGDKLQGGNILVETSMYPLGIDIGKIGDVTHYLIVHPDRILADGALSTFADIEEGSTLFSMRGDKGHLIERAGKVAEAAAGALPGGADSLAGGLVVYCAGCRIAVGEQMEGVSDAITRNFGGQPFIGCFTFGEQGQILNRNIHGNLMISAIAFGR